MWPLTERDFQVHSGALNDIAKRDSGRRGIRLPDLKTPRSQSHNGLSIDNTELIKSIAVALEAGWESPRRHGDALDIPWIHSGDILETF